MKKANPKGYWNVINVAKPKKSLPCTISTNVFEAYFQKLCQSSCEENNQEPRKPVFPESAINEDLNADITENEVIEQIKLFKRNKSPGIDLITNECLKCSTGPIIRVITKLFNLVLSSSILPRDWTVGLIKPIFKGKGSSNEVDNYRGITLLSCVGKLFTSILNKRIKTYLESTGLLGDEQAGFRKNHSTIDHIFLLHSLLTIISTVRSVYTAHL